MKSTKLPQTAKQSLWAFLIFLGIVLVGRHLVADHRQEQKIEALEVRIAQLERIQEAHAAAPETALATPGSTATPERASGQAKTKRTREKSGKTAAISDGSESGKTRMELLADKLTESHESLKFTTPVRLELNTVDSLTLIKVPGIGGQTASTILAYRNRLGGFYSPDQLRERLTWEAAQEHMDEWCTQWFKADESLMQMLRVNTLSFKEINRHPYITYEQTKALIRYRDKHKGIHSIAELEQLEAFDAETIGRLRHYLSFE